jgi:hypothetical protein
MIAHAINDDFETFLDPQYYLPVPTEERRDGVAVNRVQHEFYRKQYGVNFVFNHHDVHEPEDYAYLTRCVERLRTSLRAGDKTLFLLIRREDESTPRDFELIRTSLKQAAPGTRFIFVAVAAQVTGSRMPSVSVVQQDSCSTLYRFAASSEWKALSFADPFDDICLFRTVLNAADSLR